MPRFAVIGAGPAGIVAAIQLARAGHEVTVYEPGRASGNLWNAGFVENYPGFPGGIAGWHLAGLMEEQFWDHEFRVFKSCVGKVSFTGTHYIIDSDNGNEFDGVIICTGTRPLKAGFPGEEELAAAGLLHYGIAKLPEMERGGNILVVGGGESSMDMSLTMAERGMHVTLLHRSEPRGIKQLLDAIAAEERVTMLQGEAENARQHSDRAVVRIGGEEKPFDLIIVAVGRESRMPELEGIDIEFPPAGFRIAGDAKHGGLGQTAMAVGDGVRAAMEAGREARK